MRGSSYRQLDNNIDFVLCSVDENECDLRMHNCHEDRNCTNTEGGYICGDCPAGWANDGATGCKGLARLSVGIRVLVRLKVRLTFRPPVPGIRAEVFGV